MDCVASEHTEYMQLHGWMHNQPKHTIGMRQTAKTQITDVRYARMVHVAAEKEHHEPSQHNHHLVIPSSSSVPLAAQKTYFLLKKLIFK